MSPAPHEASEAPARAPALLRNAGVVVGTAVIAAAAFQITLLHYGRDQAIFSVVGRAILDGGAPYRDAWDFKPPLIYFVYAGARALLGPSMHAVRVVEAVALLSMVAAFVVLSRRLVASAAAGVLAGALALLTHVGLGFWETAQPESFGGVCVVWALVLATQRRVGDTAADRRRELAAWIGSGALFALAACFKPPLGGGIIFAWGAAAAREWRRASPAKRPGRVGRATAAFASGGVAVVAAVAAYLVAAGAWEDFRTIFFDYLPHYSRLGVAPAAAPSPLVRLLSGWPQGFHPFLWIGVLLALCPPRLHPREREGLVLIAGAVALQLVGIALQAKFFVYHYGGAVPLVSLLVAWGFAKLPRLPGFRWTLPLALLLGLHFLSTQHGVLRRSELRTLALLAPERAEQIHDLLYTIHDVDAGSNRRVAAWIAEHTPEDETIYVWGFEPALYDLSNRRPASRYIYNLAQRSAWSRDAARDALMDELTAANPSVIVTVANDSLHHVIGNPLDSVETLATFPRLRQLLRDRYEAVFSAGDLTVHRRRDLAPGD